MSKNKKTTTLTRMIKKIDKIDLSCEEIRAKIATLRETLGEPDEVCPDEIASEKALKGFNTAGCRINIAESTKNKGEA